ncbi:MAG: hypothetical protein DRQ49_06715 [Gammaproteobacteria bacterium]|nr:MAG: hypothetical protein DRQ41_10580 [Gammaproteobacteria bacterium]RKZ40951.1 MAG: hypothetical protein DRQ49_06715 [Gammaproteobacteria bacterium]RKZ74864.1 MAG: hypothetical protein DRQ57_09535 [Gammaproteobacteria bacterium]
MGKLEESREQHGKIDLTFLIKPIIACIQEDNQRLLRESNGKIYVLTDEIIKHIVDNQELVEKIRSEGNLFSDTKYADAIATWHKNTHVAENQGKEIKLLEEVIYQALQSQLAGKEANFFGQSATSYFSALTSLASRKMEVGIPQYAVFPDAQLSKTYPGTKALLRVPRHTFQMTGYLSEALFKAVMQAIISKLEQELPEEEIDDIIELVETGTKDNANWLSVAQNVFEQNAYGRIRRTYSCCVLEKMAESLDEKSSAIPYIRRVSDFNELVQGTLPESELSAADLILHFPTIEGTGEMLFDVMVEFSHAHALNALPFWFKFNELLSESASGDSITTTLGQHFKMNGKVLNQGFNSVFEFHLSKLTQLSNQIEAARTQKKDLPSELEIRKVLQVAVLYYVVFRDDPAKPRNALTNYKALKKHLMSFIAKQDSLENILTRIAGLLGEKIILDNNRAIRGDFKRLLQSRKLDSFHSKQKLYLTISKGILEQTDKIIDADPIVPPPSQQYESTYLVFLKVTRHAEVDHRTLVKLPISFTESLHYLTIDSDNPGQKRGMRRDINRKVLGVLFTPRDNDMRLFSLPFNDLSNLFISYDREQINGIDQKTRFKDDYLAGLAQLIYLLLVYGVFKGIERIERETQQTDKSAISHNQRTLLMLLSLFSSSPQMRISKDGKQNPEYVEERFTHDAHKAVEHLIRQYMPTKSQGFKLLHSEDWDKFVKQNYTPQQIKEQAKKHIQLEMNRDHRAANIIEGLSSGLEALWQLPQEPSLKKVAILIVSSRLCDTTRQRAMDDRKVMFGEIHRFVHEVQNAHNQLNHFYRHQAVQAFCDDMNITESFSIPSVLFNHVRALYHEGFCDVMIVTKVPFTRRIRMTTGEKTTYINPQILQAWHTEIPALRIYPLFTQKSYGIRFTPSQANQPMFLPYNQTYDEPIESDKSTLFRTASVLTNRIVGRSGADDKLHSGLTDYLFRIYPETMPIQSEAMAILSHSTQAQACLYEILRFLHANAYEQHLKIGQNKEKPLAAKLDALEIILGDGDESIGHQVAEALKFPKTKIAGVNNQTHYFSINMIALLKHLENQSKNG